MKALIIDDEKNLRNALKDLLQAFCPEITQFKEAESVVSGIEILRSFEPDLLFLDIELKDGTGFDILKQAENFSFQLIFTTAHNRYALQAFKFSAIDYLLKPIDPDELRKSVDKAKVNIRNSNLKEQLTVLMDQLASKINPDKKIVLKDSSTTYFVKVTDILFCEAEGNYTKFNIYPDKIILVSKNLKEYESLLEPSGFIRTHHAFLVNQQKIKMYDRTDGGMLILETDRKVPISQRKKEFVLQVLEKKAQ
ncbi:MAG TPA: LytTR family DNA-binding domain-containing protein [Chitinophagaceae bacterium]|nr:response regulator transcription factor [Chitinophagaceae bacterium]HPG12009.1 LytTR family DNA-binding domain-containing protein [Chitinophagaceae bacterium]